MSTKGKGSSSKKKRELKDARNLLRGSRNPTLTLTAMRNSAPTGQYRDLIDWIRLNPLLRTKLFPPVSPKSLDLLESTPALGSTSPQREIRWALAYLLGQLPEIIRFLDLTKRFERAFLKNAFEECRRSLDAVQQECGQSLWLIKNRILFLQTATGLEAQKKYSSAAIGQSVENGVVAYIVHFVSLRNEAAVTPSRFFEQFDRSLKDVELPSDLEMYIRHHIWPDINISHANLAAILRFESAGAVVDYYESFLTLCQLAICNDQQDLWNDIQLALTAFKGRVVDPRIDMMLLELQSAMPDNSLFKPEVLQAIDSFMEGRYEDARTEAVTLLETESDCFDLWEIIVRSAAITSVRMPERTLRGKVLDRMASLMSTGETFHEDLVELLKLAINFSTSSWAKSLLGFIRTEVTGNYPESSDLAAHYAALSGELLNPLRIMDFPTAQARRFYARLCLDRYGNGPAVSYGMATAERDITGVDLQPLVPEQRVLLDAYIVFIRHEYEFALKAGQELAQSEIDYYKRKSIKTVSHSLLKLGRLKDCVELIAISLTHYPQLNYILPIENVADLLDKSVRRQLRGGISLPIFYEMYSRYVGHRCDSLRNYAYEDFLLANGIKRPSEISSLAERFVPSQLVFFLRYLCVESTMDVSTEFQGSLDVARERLKVCRYLLELDSARTGVYQHEIKEINRRLTIQQRIREVEQSKIYVDIDSIKKKLERSMKESFNRYLDFLQHGIDFDSLIYRTLSRQNLLSKNYESALRITLPESEMTELFESLIVSFRDEYVSSNEHGLDGYLSVRIRHGTLYGHLRSPLEREHLITRRDITGTYKPNDYWLSRVGTTNLGVLNTINKSLAKFSEQFDLLVQEIISEWIQIKKSASDKGLFDFVLTRPEVHLLSNFITVDTTFDEFVDAVFTSFGERLEGCLLNIGLRFASEGKTRVVDMLNTLQAEVSTVAYVTDLGDFNRAINTARTHMPIVINRIIEWFSVAKTTAREPFLIEDAIRISEASVRTFHQTFKTDLRVLNDQKAPFDAHFLSGIVDIFFILFENIVRHSGIENSPGALITILYEPNAISLQVNNSIRKGVATEQAKHRLENIRNAMKQDSYLESVRTEGGTGFYKIRKILVHDFNVPTQIEFGFSDDETFAVEIKLPFKAR
jgi:hypothetical protein